MQYNTQPFFILVDDDPLCNLLTRSMLRHVSKDCDLIDFTLPQAALDYITDTYKHPDYYRETILFLDINMPLISGWDFMKRFDDFDERIKNNSMFLYFLLR